MEPIKLNLKHFHPMLLKLLLTNGSSANFNTPSNTTFLKLKKELLLNWPIEFQDIRVKGIANIRFIHLGKMCDNRDSLASIYSEDSVAVLHLIVSDEILSERLGVVKKDESGCECCTIL